MKHTPTPIILVCETCGLIPLMDDEGGCHIVAGHGQHDENGECAECPIPVQCGPITYYIQKSSHDELLEALKKSHACATVRDDGSCDGCFVSEAIQKAEGK